MKNLEIKLAAGQGGFIIYMPSFVPDGYQFVNVT